MTIAADLSVPYQHFCVFSAANLKYDKAMSDPDPDVIYSRFCRHFTWDGHKLEVNIYRLSDRPGWQLEVINEEGTSTVWDDLFANEREANDAFQEALADEGIAAFFENVDTVVPFPGGRFH